MARKSDHHKRLDAEQPWRRWYKTARWEALRQQAFVRDRFTCQRSGVICMGKSPAPDSPVANHIKRHQGKPELFWSLENIETITKAVHDSLIQKQEKSGVVVGSDISGRPVDPNHIWNRV